MDSFGVNGDGSPLRRRAARVLLQLLPQTVPGTPGSWGGLPPASARLPAPRRRLPRAPVGRGTRRQAASDHHHPFGDRVSVAAVNGPAATVASGDPAALAVLAAACEADGVRTRTISVDYASHGPQIEEIRQETGFMMAQIRGLISKLSLETAVEGTWPERLTGSSSDRLRKPILRARRGVARPARRRNIVLRGSRPPVA